MNRGKYGITLDLADEEGMATLRELIRVSDVLVHNFLPRTTRKLGITYPEVSSINPGIIYIHITGFPPGPYHEEPGFDALVQAMGGLMAVTGEGERPAKVGWPSWTCFVLGPPFPGPWRPSFHESGPVGGVWCPFRYVPAPSPP